MDPQLLGTGGVVVALVGLIGYLLKQNHADRKQYQDHIKESSASHQTEMAELKADFAALEDRFENERKARWEAEDANARLRRERDEALARHPPGGTL